MILKEAWRLLRVNRGQPCTLFHGWHGTRCLPLDKMLRAVEEQVWNPGTRRGPGFVSGWHVLFSQEECEEYLERFSACGDIVVGRITVACIRGKPRATSNVRLARYMRIDSADWTKALQNHLQNR